MDYAKGLGWKVDPTAKGWQFKAPKEAIQPGFKGLVVTHGSPSDHRAFKNFLGDLRNEGGLVWPPEKARRVDRKNQDEARVTELHHDPISCLRSRGLYEDDMSPDDLSEMHDMAHEQAG